METELGAEAERRLRRETLEGIAVEPLYSADHVAAEVECIRDAEAWRLPIPSAQTNGSRWRIWQEVAVSCGAAARAALAREAERELGGIWLSVDDDVTAPRLAAILGDELGEREVAIEWAGEPLAAAALLTAGAGAAGVAPDRLRGCLGCDPLGALARRGSLSGSACDHVVAAARWASLHAPGMRAALVSTAPYADAGADAVQEIAFALATGAETLRWLLDAGFAPADAAAQVLVSTTAGRDLYLQVAKLRALRLTWAMLLASVDAPPHALRLHARTAWRTKGRRDPGTDVVRATIETLAAVLGGCTDVTTAAFLGDELELALGMPLGSATQLLLRHEAGLGAVADVAGGSWYVESLTAMLARRAWELFEGIERRGGMARELAVGAVARQVAEAAERRRRALEDKRLAIVGVTVQAAKRPVPLPHRPLVATARIEERVTSSAPPALRGAADSSELFAAAVEAAAGGATVAALSAALPSTRPPLRAPALQPWRDSEPFEAVPAGAVG